MCLNLCIALIDTSTDLELFYVKGICCVSHRSSFGIYLDNSQECHMEEYAPLRPHKLEQKRKSRFLDLIQIVCIPSIKVPT